MHLSASDLVNLIPKPIQPGCVVCLATNSRLSHWWQGRQLRKLHLVEDYRIFTDFAIVLNQLVAHHNEERVPWSTLLTPGRRVLVRRPIELVTPYVSTVESDKPEKHTRADDYITTLSNQPTVGWFAARLAADHSKFVTLYDVTITR